MKNIYNTQKEWYKVNVPLNLDFRLKKLNQLKVSLKEHENDLFKAMYEDLGKHEYEVYMTELSLIYREIDALSKLLRKKGLNRRVHNDFLLGKSSKISYQARGQVLIIAPFNYPVQLSILPLVGSVAAGNSTILKLSEHVPHTNAVLRKVFESVFDLGHVSVVEGAKEVVEELLEMSHDLIFFTGSTKVGQIVMEAAAKHLTPVVLELGGKSPVVVFEDADIEMAAKKIAWGKIINAGQTCIAPDYILVHHSKKQQLISSIISSVQEMLPDGFIKVIHEDHASRLATMMNGVHDHIIFGGKVEGDKVSFTIVDEINIDQEIFGPILPVLSYKDESDLIDSIKVYDYPLTLYSFSRSRSKTEWLQHRIRSGSVMENDLLMHISNDAIPFGGIRSSGIGSYHGEHSLKVFAHEKPIVRGWGFMNPFLKMPYKAWYQSVALLRKFF